jgi:hypothetical protein
LQTQLVDVVDPAVDCEFDRQATQVLATVAPVVVEYVPAPQSVHATEPVVVLYFPAAHAKHVPPSGPVNPRLQTQLVAVVDPAVDCVYDGQSVHAAEPVVVLYLPALHIEQKPAWPVYPGLQAAHCPPSQEKQDFVFALNGPPSHLWHA